MVYRIEGDLRCAEYAPGRYVLGNGILDRVFYCIVHLTDLECLNHPEGHF